MLLRLNGNATATFDDAIVSHTKSLKLYISMVSTPYSH